ncbi:MAG TPA: Tad domain-containing protein, partial [Anaerolineaceae bacterium]|nr:Tad domain-containing protein [Anaerolineaceae bacterium]
MNPHRSERGQILILFVLGLIGLMALTALAIDGSMVYSDRRFDQTVADSAALAGATAASDTVNGLSNQLFSCSDTGVINAMNLAIYAAVDRAAANGFNGSGGGPALAMQDLSTQHGVYVTCNDAANPKHLEIKVQLSSETATSFAHLIFGQNRIRNTVDSVVRLYPQTAAAAGLAIVGLDDACDAVLYNGNVTNTIAHGGVFSNGGISKTGSSGTLSADTYGTVKANCGNSDYTGDGDVKDGIHVSGHPTINGAVSTGHLPVSYDFGEIDCSTVAAVSFDSSTNTWPAGRHAGFKLNNKEVIHLAPGLHCLTSGIQATAKGELYGNGVTLYFASGSFDGNGNGKIELSVPLTAGPVLNGIQGIVIFVDPDNPDNSKNAVVDMEGTSDAEYTGTVYVPSG